MAGPPSAARARQPLRRAAVPLVAAVVGGAVAVLVVLALDDDGGSDPRAGGPTCSAVDVAEDVLPSVVTVAVAGADGSGGNGSGSVFRKGGYLLTNEHVVSAAVDGGADVTVRYHDGSSSAATIVGADFATDLAILKAEDGAEGRPVQPYDDAGSARVGEPVVALGAPLGLSNTVTAGIVSALGRYVPIPADTGRVAHLLDAIQTDASINPGNSGGPLVDCSGTQVGVNSAICTAPNAQGVPGGGSVGLGFAIPMSVAVPIAGELIDTGEANHPDLGPADDAGLAPGDVIVQIDGRPARDTEALVLTRLRHDVGDSVELTYLRGGERHTTELVLGPAPTR
ncbi:MAG: PDZ domain-containing protein [Nocardioidaceae bacterium]|nr:PDZ domain-containing protein [Nocardioidaceae bacterium]